MADFVHIERPGVEIEEPRGPSPVKEPAPSEGLDFLSLHPFVRDSVQDKVFGTIIGSALGDAIGLYTEFLTQDASKTIYSTRKFQLVAPTTPMYADSHRSSVCAPYIGNPIHQIRDKRGIDHPQCGWTDDTDQALLIIFSYLHNRGTQGLRALDRLPMGLGALVGSVVGRKEFLTTPTKMAIAAWIKSKRSNAPNGSLMRTHPISVIGVGLTEEATWRAATEVGRTTHADPRCVVSCCISVGLIRAMLRGEVRKEEDVDACIERSYAWVKSQPELMNPGDEKGALTPEEIERHLERTEFEKHVYAKTFEELDLDSRAAMGYVYKCLGSAVLTLRFGMRESAKGSVVSAEVFENLITDLIMYAGDADTNAAAAGALLGCWLGFSRLPPTWERGLAHREWLLNKVERFSKMAGVTLRAAGAEDTPEADEDPQGGKPPMTQAQMDQRDRNFVTRQIEQDAQRKAQLEREKQKRKFSGWLKGMIGNEA
ncbi:ADP-ribosylglycohydrolase [Mytilinidion resinicola]|uniref:ADP-ribosylglycohydrolase n=1 Tax=Mytilinidion resinicola TaxID=574789 RepID=A0A6A6Z852_9PEZI|nr:ADP-ribosylglycohydrolase [Mytilinidion resinicola]KAF2816889.1 ADP-ribosylglycohydrolase [Mytilinidion resinicola]